MKKNFEASFQLLGGYLHEDWADEFNSDFDAVQAMVTEAPEMVPKAAQEIRQLLSMHLDEKELGEFMFTKLGCYFDPEAKGETNRQWLEGVLEQWEKVRGIKR